MKKPLLACALVANLALAGGCHGPTTGAEIDRIMAEARQKAAIEQERARANWAVSAYRPDTQDAVAVESPPQTGR